MGGGLEVLTREILLLLLICSGFLILNIKIDKLLKFISFFFSFLPVNGEGGGSLVDDNFSEIREKTVCLAR